MASANEWATNCDRAEALVRDAAAGGAQLVLLQELFDGDYFCIEQHASFLASAAPIDRHPTVERFAALARELGVVLPVSVFERAGNTTFNTVVVVDADGSRLGTYRKTQIPDGPGPATRASECGTPRSGESVSASAGTSGSPSVRVAWR